VLYVQVVTKLQVNSAAASDTLDLLAPLSAIHHAPNTTANVVPPSNTPFSSSNTTSSSTANSSNYKVPQVPQFDSTDTMWFSNIVSWEETDSESEEDDSDMEMVSSSSSDSSSSSVGVSGPSSHRLTVAAVTSHAIEVDEEDEEMWE
jgi:hypothetical protein